MSFKSVYHRALSRQGYHSDAGQATVVACLDRLFAELQQYPASKPFCHDLWRKLTHRKRGVHAVKGCYLWGGVGRGKTWLMDLFYEAAPLERKMRFHFHEFMHSIHKLLDQFKGRKNPLHEVAGHLAQQARLVCLDEFHVSDITDAMLLYGLLDALYRRGVVLVMTSNIPPDELYRNGLQRSRFLPAIELIRQHNAVIELVGERDHRMQSLGDNINYYCPLSRDTDLRLQNRFLSLARGPVSAEESVTINDRPMHSRMAADNIIWFDFEAICSGPRAAADYIVIAQRYDHVIISNIFSMDDNHDDIVKRFINLVDEFYDRRIGLIISATRPPADLYSGRRFEAEYQRTVSRLEHIKSTAGSEGMSSCSSAVVKRQPFPG